MCPTFTDFFSLLQHLKLMRGLVSGNVRAILKAGAAAVKDKDTAES